MQAAPLSPGNILLREGTYRAIGECFAHLRSKVCCAQRHEKKKTCVHARTQTGGARAPACSGRACSSSAASSAAGATQRPAMNIVPDAWTRPWPPPEVAPQGGAFTRFPAQCPVRMAVFCPNSLPINAFRHLLTQIPRGFRSELTLSETQSLIACFERQV